MIRAHGPFKVAAKGKPRASGDDPALELRRQVHKE